MYALSAKIILINILMINGNNFPYLMFRLYSSRVYCESVKTDMYSSLSNVIEHLEANSI